MRNKSLILMTICAALSTGLSAQSVYPGQHAGKMKKVTTAPMQVESFDLKDVRLLPSRFRDNMMRDSAWMTSIATNRLLHGFRNNAGVFAGREGGYMTVKKLGGWESLDCELRGHTTGHLLSAYALMYASTGSEIFKLKGDSLVTGLAEVQAALGNGYLSAYPEELINRNIRGTSVWAPWYTLHKLFSGLIDQYLYADNKPALEVVTRMGDWAYNIEHNITPKSVSKDVKELIELTKIEEDMVTDGKDFSPKKGKKKASSAGMDHGHEPYAQDTSTPKVEDITPEELFNKIEELDRQMKAAAKQLEFEKAAKLRDQLGELRQQWSDMHSAGESKLKKPASTKGRKRTSSKSK